jgi:hypothetical protein
MALRYVKAARITDKGSARLKQAGLFFGTYILISFELG